MTELKTLKDLGKRIWNTDEDCVIVGDLKAEAVKWVKALDYEEEEGSFEIKEKFMQFFNLTEEDLQEKEE